jgi:hypothetical protein
MATPRLAVTCVSSLLDPQYQTKKPANIYHFVIYNSPLIFSEKSNVATIKISSIVKECANVKHLDISLGMTV